MKCLVFKSEKKQGAYLYLAHERSFEDVPSELMASLGVCVEVMELDLSVRKRLASQNIEQVKANLQTMGYHLQIPPEFSTTVINYGV